MKSAIIHSDSMDGWLMWSLHPYCIIY